MSWFVVKNEIIYNDSFLKVISKVKFKFKLFKKKFTNSFTLPKKLNPSFFFLNPSTSPEEFIIKVFLNKASPTISYFIFNFTFKTNLVETSVFKSIELLIDSNSLV